MFLFLIECIVIYFSSLCWLLMSVWWKIHLFFFSLVLSRLFSQSITAWHVVEVLDICTQMTDLRRFYFLWRSCKKYDHSLIEHHKFCYVWFLTSLPPLKWHSISAYLAFISLAIWLHKRSKSEEKRDRLWRKLGKGDMLCNLLQNNNTMNTNAK